MLRALRSSAPRLAAVVAIAYSLLIVGALASQDGHAEWFLKFGADDPAMVDKAREELGIDDVSVPYQIHHDGTGFWLHAHDPLLLDPSDAEAYLTHPAYRVRRVMYPLFASVGGLFGEQGLLLSMLAVNVAAVAAGTFWTSRLAEHLGASAIWGLGFALNPAVLTGVFLDLSDTLALAALVGATLAARRRRVGWAVVACIVAVLARETTVPCVLALAFAAPLARRSRWTLAGAPLLAFGAWSLYSAWRVSFLGLSNGSVAFVPGSGYVAGFTDEWPRNGNWSDAMIAVVLAAAMTMVLIRWWRSRSLEMWIAASNAVLWPFLDVNVLRLATDSTRIVGPAILFLTIDIARERAASGRVDLLRPDYDAGPRGPSTSDADRPAVTGGT